ncbi:FKBP-type peptidyl-prolyl cis-trans isomerase [Bacteroidota bacterium]
MLFKINRNYIILILLISFLTQCKNENSEYNTHESGLKYKFFKLNSNEKKVAIDEIMELKYQLKTEDDSLIEETNLFRMRLKPPSHPGGSIEDGLSLMHVGDSALFIIDAESYYTLTRGIELPAYIKKGSKIKFYMKLNDIINLKELDSYREKMYHRSPEQEQMLLNDYLERTNTSIEPTLSGLYFIEMTEGTGEKPKPGQTVIVHYTGYFIDGNIFSTTYRSGEPFKFRYGAGEVIQGWEEGIIKMNVGGKYKLIIPSHLAYGDEGKGNRILPHSTLIFEIELLGAY